MTFFIVGSSHIGVGVEVKVKVFKCKLFCSIAVEDFFVVQFSLVVWLWMIRPSCNSELILNESPQLPCSYMKQTIASRSMTFESGQQKSFQYKSKMPTTMEDTLATWSMIVKVPSSLYYSA